MAILRVLTARLGIVFAFFMVTLAAMQYALAAGDDQKYADTITIVQGQTTLLPVPGVVRVSIGEEQIANAQPTAPGEVLLTGLKAGTTDLRVWTENGGQRRYLLQVVDNSWVHTLEVANIVLHDVEGVTAREDKGVVMIEGRILRQEDMSVVDDLKRKLEADIKAGRVVFKVVQPNVNLQAMVMMDVQVVEMRRQELNDYGIRWDTSTAGPAWGVVGHFDGSSIKKDGTFGGLLLTEDKSPIKVDSTHYVGTSIGSRLNFLEQKGVARVLAQPKLVTRSGTKAEFLAGGEIPIPIPQALGVNTIEFKQYGVNLKILPVADPDGFIQTAIDVNVSDIDNSVQIQGVPGLTTRKTTMEMNVLSGQTMVISGILKATDSKALDKFPGLSAIPILGELFKSRNFQQSTTELMIFVTPYLVDPDSKTNRDMLKYAKDLNKKGKKDAQSFSIFD